MLETKNKVTNKVADKSRQLLNYIIRPYTSSSSADLSLWNYQDVRLDMGVFNGNVPSIIINQDQKILDFNIAFRLFFDEFISQDKNLHISKWYEILDNFRRLPKRTSNLYGEGLLPITDRNRIVYVSKKYGRCVFTKIMNPLIDRKTSKILGWSIALNINSITKRQNYFEDLDQALKKETTHLQYVTAFDSVISSHRDYQEALRMHTAAIKSGAKVVDLSAHTGELGLRLAAAGMNVHVLESDIEFLRIVKAKFSQHYKKPKLVLRKRKEFYDLPKNRFDNICVTHGLKESHKKYELILQKIYQSLQDGGSFTISSLIPEKARYSEDLLEKYFKNELKAHRNFDAVKYQFNNAASTYIKQSKKHTIDIERLIEAAQKAGFTLENKKSCGWFYFLEFKKQ